MEIKANYVDIKGRKHYPAVVKVENGRIASIEPTDEEVNGYVMPGFVDSHVHIESSMLVPSEFARLAVCHGTVATVSDPHEIGNVLGVEGVKYMIENGESVPFKFYFGAPSCVPATPFETAGAAIGVEEVGALLQDERIVYLAEMMNWPGVLNAAPEVVAKIAAAKKLGKPVDGHAPGLKGEQAKAYVDAGMSTDHECFTLEEAQDKLKYGMKVLIREGSAARNFDALHALIPDHAENLMFCSDDKHPDVLVKGHIDELVRRACEQGYDLYDILRIACVNPVEHYGLDVGLLRVGDPADFIVADARLFVKQTYIDGELVAENGETRIARQEDVAQPNKFDTGEKNAEEFAVSASSAKVLAIQALDGEIVTERVEAEAKWENGLLHARPEDDLLKITVVNRYEEAAPAIAFIKGFGLKRGAIAGSVGHDSHNIIAVGADDESICRAVNAVIRQKGGLSAVDGEREEAIGLPVAGLMSAVDGYEVAATYEKLDRMAKEMGSQLGAPYMTLSFMALLVIPKLKLSDKGLFDGERFVFVEGVKAG